MSSELYVFAPLRVSEDGPLSSEIALCGRIRWSDGTGEFQYAQSWLDTRKSYGLDPANLPLRQGPFTTQVNHGIHGVLADAGPDAWGSKLLEMARGAPPSPLEVLRLTNGSGTGALLFSQSRTKPAPVRSLAPTVGIEEMEAAAREISQGEPVTNKELEIVFQAGSSLGGARPKVNLIDAGVHYIAKFQRHADDLDIPRLEWACLQLARLAGLVVPETRLIEVNGRSALLVERFDRIQSRRIHYLSFHALAMTTSRMRKEDVYAPGGRLTFGAIAATCRRIGVDQAGEILFRRMLFNILVGNTDDHLKNHGLLYDGSWKHAPTFDVVATGGTLQAVGVGTEGRNSSVQNAMSDIGAFGLTESAAERILGDVMKALRSANEILEQAGMRAGERKIAMGRMIGLRE